MDSHQVQERVRAGDVWYTKDHFSWLDQPQVRRTVERRSRWAREQVLRYQRDVGRRLQVLDTGCGDGLLLVELAGPALDLWAVDLNELRIRRARKRAPQARFCLGNADGLGFRSGSFDVVIASHMLEHLEDDHAGLAELTRVLRAGGLLLIGVPNEGSMLGWLRNHVIQPSILRETDHRQFYTQRLMEGRLRQHGCSVHAVLHENFFVPCTHLFDACHRPSWGWQAMNWLAQRLPSQCAGFFMAAVKA